MLSFLLSNVKLTIFFFKPSALSCILVSYMKIQNLEQKKIKKMIIAYQEFNILNKLKFNVACIEETCRFLIEQGKRNYQEFFQKLTTSENMNN